jgi:hypothetical protein
VFYPWTQATHLLDPPEPIPQNGTGSRRDRNKVSEIGARITVA